MSKTINYITNLNVADFSGGWSGMNHHVYNELNKRFSVHLVQNINPPYLLTQRILSKLFRLAKLKGIYPAFTNARLNRISAAVRSNLQEGSLNFFHGATPWLNVNNNIPYALYLDASFATYINVYHNSSDFSNKQLSLLFNKETSFLQNAKAVFFSSYWAMNDARYRYDMDGANFFVAGLGGGFDNEALKETVSPYFLFVGLDFYGKGGDKVVHAFKNIRQLYPQFKLKIVGEKPPDDFLKNDSVEYLGFIDKSSKQGSEQMATLFGSAYAFVLPTSKDMTPLVLIEAASMGCPVITTRVFGIPEIVKDGETGLLINPGTGNQPELEQSMKKLCEDFELRNELGKKAKIHIQENFTWKKTGDTIADKILELL